MSRIIVTAVTALSMLFIGIRALSYQAQRTDELGLSGANAEAANMTDAVVGDGAIILGNALPRLFVVVLLVLLVGALALTR